MLLLLGKDMKRLKKIFWIDPRPVNDPHPHRPEKYNMYVCQTYEPANEEKCEMMEEEGEGYITAINIEEYNKLEEENKELKKKLVLAVDLCYELKHQKHHGIDEEEWRIDDFLEKVGKNK